MNKQFIPVVGVLVSGSLCISAFPGSPIPMLAWICFVPWLASVRYAKPFHAAVSGLALACLYAMPCTWNGIYTAAKTLSDDPVKAGVFTILFFFPILFPSQLWGFMLLCQD